MALLFSILKVIGMILLIIVIILAVIIVCLLFIPVCYEASGDISAGNYRVRVHWFLRVPIPVLPERWNKRNGTAAILA